MKHELRLFEKEENLSEGGRETIGVLCGKKKEENEEEIS